MRPACRGGGRLHDLFVRIEAMTPGQFKSGGAGLRISHARYDSPFGPVLMAATARGICHLGFITDPADASPDEAVLRHRFPNADLGAADSGFHHQALAAFAAIAAGSTPQQPVALHLRGTDFQIKVWEALLRIPVGGLASYGAVAAKVCSPAAARVTGAAIGANPVAFLIPCHRVIRNTGRIGDYRWGTIRKRAMLGWEAARG